LRMFHDGLLALEHDPLAGVVSPSLMGSTGTMPLTVIGVVWDMARHMVGSIFGDTETTDCKRGISLPEQRKRSSLRQTIGCSATRQSLSRRE
jgi:hypothetical protein